ncbi:MAG: ring-opening amidohydrolase [Pseudolabrys sp.]
MAIEVAKIELKTVQDASGVEERIKAGQFTADQVIAVVGKTEGNGGVNDFTRILADQAFRRVLAEHGSRSEAEIGAIPMVWSGGCDGVITPHATVFARNDKIGPAAKARLAIGTAMSAELLPEDIGRPAMVEKVAAAVKAAMKNAGIDDVKDVHYVQTKTPLLTIESVRDAERRGQHVACEVHDSMGVSNGTTALGIAVALGETRSAGLDLPARPRAEDLGGRLVNCFMKCEADRTGQLRGRRQIMLDDSDVPWHRHAKAAVGGVAAAAIGDPAVFVSVDAMHQGPQGGGPCIAIIDAGE